MVGKTVKDYIRDQLKDIWASWNPGKEFKELP